MMIKRVVVDEKIYSKEDLGGYLGLYNFGDLSRAGLWAVKEGFKDEVRYLIIKLGGDRHLCVLHNSFDEGVTAEDVCQGSDVLKKLFSEVSIALSGNKFERGFGDPIDLDRYQDCSDQYKFSAHLFDNKNLHELRDEDIKVFSRYDGDHPDAFARREAGYDWPGIMLVTVSSSKGERKMWYRLDDDGDLDGYGFHWDFGSVVSFRDEDQVCDLLNDVIERAKEECFSYGEVDCRVEKRMREIVLV